MSRSTRGDSLVELIVALVIIELAGAAALATALCIERLTRHATHGHRDDATRVEQYRATETTAACAHASLPDTLAVDFPATTDRPALHAAVRCGR